MAAQFTFVKGKEYKVVNWIDGVVYVTTFSAAGKESTVKSAATIARVMANLVSEAHAEALVINAKRDVKPGRETYNNNGKEIAGFDVIEVQTNGEEIKKASYPACLEDTADNLAYALDKEFGHTGVYYIVRTRRYA